MKQEITAIVGVLVTIVTAKIHHLFVGNLAQPSAIYALSFDTETFDLKVTKNITATGSHHWITFSNQKTSLYGTSFFTPEISSYSVLKNGTDLRLDKVLQTTKRCGDNDRSAHIVTLQREPQTVYMASWPGRPGCGTVLSTLPNGTLSSVVQSFDYSSAAGIHGLALHPSDSYMYAADTTGDTLWTHVLSNNGTVSKTQRTNVSSIGKGPRHVATHPNGLWLYTLFEGSNTISAFPIDTQTGYLGSPSHRYSLLPGASYKSPINSTPPHDDKYWSAEITISPSNKILWATARAKGNTTDFGYISAFSLDSKGTIIDRLFIVPTTSTGGIANSVSVAPDTDEFVAMTDLKNTGRDEGGWGNGYVQIWQVKGLDGSAPTAKAVAQADIKDGGCCANVIWYD